MKLDGLFSYALQTLWCVPDQDKQVIFRPTKISNPSGIINKVRVTSELNNLPEMNVKFHVYQIGQLFTDKVGLSLTSTWVKLSDLAKRDSIVGIGFSSTGRVINQEDIWLKSVGGKNLIIAVRDNKQTDLFKDTFYLKLYTSAFINSSIGDRDGIEITYSKISIVDDILALQYKQNLASNQSYAIVNGYYIDRITPFSVGIGDNVEFIEDPSIDRVVTFNVRDLLTYTSMTDRASKYLIDFGKSDDILFYDDIDFFVVNNDNNKETGLYLGRLDPSSFRTITHRVIGIPVASVARLINQIYKDKGSEINKEFYIKAVVRKTANVKKLPNESLRLKELYKLDSEQIRSVLTGTNSLMPSWRATNLETSILNNLLSANINEITLEQILNLYGYDAINKLIFDNLVNADETTVLVPVGYTTNSTAYEYDSEGLLLERHPNPSGGVYHKKNALTRKIEFLYGVGDSHFTDYIYTHEDNVDVPSVDYRVYVSYEHDVFIETLNWRLATEDDYSIVDGKFVFNEGYIYVVRLEDRFLSYSFSLTNVRGIVEFDIRHNKNFNNYTGTRELSINFGNVDVFLNDRYLIKDIDYYLVGSKVTIVNKMLLLPFNQIHLRCYGFANDDLSLDQYSESGFIKHGLLSNNGILDIRDNKVVRITVDGKLKDISEVSFFEDNTTGDESLNGKSYQVSYVKNNLPVDFNRDREIERNVVRYLSTLKDQRADNRINPIPQRYVLYSPMISRLLYVLVNEVNTITLESLNTNTKVLEYLKTNGYDELFKVDPLNELRVVNNDIIEVHPSINQLTELDLYAYRFLTKVLDIYELDSIIELSNFVRLKS